MDGYDSIRNLTSHTYNQTTADAIVKKIDEDYFDQFKSLIQVLGEKQ